LGDEKLFIEPFKSIITALNIFKKI